MDFDVHIMAFKWLWLKLELQTMSVQISSTLLYRGADANFLEGLPILG